MERLAELGGLHLGPQDELALDDALALAFAGIRQLLLGATEGILGRPPQGLAPEDVVVGDRDLVGHRLVGSLRLEPGDVGRQLCLLVEAQPTAEVEEQPLDLELGQLEGRPEVEAEGDGPDAGQEVESG